MTGLSQSAFLQALGWATLNSIWQMALLWCCFLGANYFFRLSAAKKYFFSVTSLMCGTAWFVVTFIFYYNGSFSYEIGISQAATYSLQGFLPIILTAASVTYLLLLSVPAHRLFCNWRKVQYIRTHGLHKIDIKYKLFVKRITTQLGIKQTVGIYFSELVKSPLTIGYIKPLILLPLASINNLTAQQVEAVLLHELSHIKRFDYLINIVVSCIYTILYFNPFARLLIRVVQEERENCCDQMVLQFGYDKVSYASALLSLEKTSLQSQTFVLAAAGKRNLLSRIEKIVGIEKKIAFQFNHFIGLVAALFCIIVFNSLLITTKEKNALSVSFKNLANPFYFFEEMEPAASTKAPRQQKSGRNIVVLRKGAVQQKKDILYFTEQYSGPEEIPQIIQAAYNEAEISMSKERAEHIKKTLENTKKVLTTYEWKEVEKTIADGLTSSEKAAVKQEYLKEVNRIDWEHMEKGLEAAYENINWAEVDGSLNIALTNIKLDSLQKTCEQTLKVLEKVQAEASSLSNISILPFPDESIDTIKKREQEVQSNLRNIKAIKEKKVISL